MNPKFWLGLEKFFTPNDIHDLATHMFDPSLTAAQISQLTTLGKFITRLTNSRPEHFYLSDLIHALTELQKADIVVAINAANIQLYLIDGPKINPDSQSSNPNQ